MRHFQGQKNGKINIVPVQTKINIGNGRLNLKLGNIICNYHSGFMYCFIYYCHVLTLTGAKQVIGVLKCLAGVH